MDSGLHKQAAALGFELCVWMYDYKHTLQAAGVWRSAKQLQAITALQTKQQLREARAVVECIHIMCPPLRSRATQWLREAVDMAMIMDLLTDPHSHSPCSSAAAAK